MPKDAGTRVARDRNAWTLFWADPAQSHCASGAPEIRRSLVRHWSAFAGSLPRAARVLDLGCGAGTVGRMLLAARADLRVTGIDAAQVPPSGLPQMHLLSETDMETLPFGDGSFDAVVSQFGYEYSQTDAAAQELSRVLAPGASLSLLVHHADSAIVRETRERLGAVTAFLAPAMRSSFCGEDTTGFHTQLALLVQRYPDDTLIAQLADALPSRLGWLKERRLTTWESLEDALAPERCVSDSLSARCVAPSRIDEWLAPLDAACDLAPVTVLRESDGTPIAWCVAGTRSG